MSANEHDDDQPDSFEVIDRLRAERDEALALLRAITQYHDYQSIIDEPERARIAQLLGDA